MNLERAADMLTRAAKEIEKQALPLVSAHDMQRREAIVLALGRIEGVAMMLSGIKDSGLTAVRREPEREGGG